MQFYKHLSTRARLYTSLHLYMQKNDISNNLQVLIIIILIVRKMRLAF